MYTSCPECGTVFRISTAELRAAEGHVRCGHCSATFNAIGTLTDEPPEPPTPTPGTEAAPADGPAPAGEEPLEFNIPEERWPKFFDGSMPAKAPDGNGDAALGGNDQEIRRGDEPAGGDLNLDEDADWQALLKEVRDEDAGLDPVYVISEEPPPVAAEEALPPDLPWDDAALGVGVAPAPLPADFGAGLPGQEPPAATDEPLLLGDRPFVWQSPPAVTTAADPRRRGFAIGSVVAGLLLLMQLIHQQRDQLATNPALTEPLQRIYGALGLPLWPAWDLRAYEVRNAEAVADRTSRGALDILARIVVVGNERVGLPLVRVTLRDRFSRPLGSRVFQPVEYLAKNPRPHEPVAPGTIIPVEISLRDLGTSAQGFDVDVCLMAQRDGITCRSEYGPYAR